MAKINIAWINDEVIESLENNGETIDGYIADAEHEIDSLCFTNGQTAVQNIPLDDDGYYKSPILVTLSKYKVKKLVYSGYKFSSTGNSDAYDEKDDEDLKEEVEKWENKITPASVFMQLEVASSPSALTRSIPLGG